MPLLHADLTPHRAPRGVLWCSPCGVATFRGRVQDASSVLRQTTRTCPQPFRLKRFLGGRCPVSRGSTWGYAPSRFDRPTSPPYRRQVCLLDERCQHPPIAVSQYGVSSEQAHVPAEQPPSGQDPRLPPAHADSCRSQHPVGPPSQGPQRALGLDRSGRPAVLPGPARLTRSQDFTAALRGGRRAGRSLVVMHLRTAQAPADQPARVGFVTSKAVGNAVVRNQVRRRLRHQMAARLSCLPPGALVVVRATPSAAGASSAELGAELDRVLARLGLTR